MFIATFRTQTFGHVVNAGEQIALGESYRGDGGVLKTECAMTLFAIEVNVLIVVDIVTIVTVAEFETHTIAAILNDVNQMMLTEE